jgi:cytochrome o ubiquinol oxidase subunit 1
MPLYVLGAAGMARRTQEVFEPAFRPWLVVALVGALLLLCALAALFVQLWVSIARRDANRVFAGDPWDGRGLEWSVSAPPPEYNFAVIPHVESRDSFFDAKRCGDPYPAVRTYEAIVLPKNSGVGPAVGVLATAAAFGLVWHMWWLALMGVLSVIGLVIARSFERDVERTIPAKEVQAQEAIWRSTLTAARPISRHVETTSANQGLAEVSA